MSCFGVSTHGFHASHPTSEQMLAICANEAGRELRTYAYPANKTVYLTIYLFQTEALPGSIDHPIP